MWTRGSRGAVTAGACVLLGLYAGGCSKGGAGFDLARLIQPPGASPGPGPAASSPASALRLFEWCYDNKALATYGELFPVDFRFFCGPLDSAGAGYRGTPWTREDELIFATRLFVGRGPNQPPASSIRLILDRSFIVLPDPSYAQWDATGRWHRSIRTQMLLNIQISDGSEIDIAAGAASFYLVRGDSAAIPEELRLRGFGPDSSRWYIRLWDDETAQPVGGAFAARRAGGGMDVASRPSVLGAQPSRSMSWCQLKTIYR